MSAEIVKLLGEAKVVTIVGLLLGLILGLAMLLTGDVAAAIGLGYWIALWFLGEIIYFGLQIWSEVAEPSDVTDAIKGFRL